MSRVSRQRRRQLRLLAEGRCISCGHTLGERATKYQCRKCADAKNARLAVARAARGRLPPKISRAPGERKLKDLPPRMKAAWLDVERFRAKYPRASQNEALRQTGTNSTTFASAKRGMFGSPRLKSNVATDDEAFGFDDDDEVGI